MSMQDYSEQQVREDYHEQLGRLVLLLELEQEALKNRQFDTIDNCARDKEAALIQLEQLEHERLQIIQAQASPGEKQSPFEADEDLSALLERCRELNTINGGIVEISKQFNQRMLESILDSGVPEEKLYDETGNKPGKSHRHIMAKI